MKNLILILLFPILLFAKENNSIISLKSSARISVPADIIYFTIDISSDNPDPKQAFESHKILEKKLLNLINEFNIPDSSIQYSLMSIRKSRGQKDKEIIFGTSQRIKVALPSMDKYYDFQIALLKNGFYEYRGAFASTSAAKAKNDAYKLALDNAKEEAEQIAKALGKKVGKIIEISTSVNDSRQYESSLEISRPSLSSLMEIEQKVAVVTYLDVKFELVLK